MRIRHKPWAKPELEASSFFVMQPVSLRNKWKQSYKRQQPLYIELGCGKGGFVSQAAFADPDHNYLAVDIKYEMLGLAKRKVEKAFSEGGRETDNVLLTAYNIEHISDFLGDNDKADRIYINFCNPWPRMKHKKHRLTHPRQLMHYRDILADDGEIHFKTDDDGLFKDSLGYFEECGFEVTYITYDLHASGYEHNIMTEHEKMFSDEGIKIKFLIAKKSQLKTEVDEVDRQN